MKEILWKTILTCCTFLFMQAFFGLVVAGLLLLLGRTEQASSLTSPGLIAGATILSDIASIWIAATFWHTIRIKETWQLPKKMTSKRAWAISLGALAFIVGTFGVGLLNEQFDLADQLEEQFMSLSHNWVGILCIAIIGPITEELLFREGIAGYWLRQGHNPWLAILVSSLLFGLVHMNPTQIFSAFFIGLLLGTLYWKTRNIWLCSLMHILNNSLSLLMLNIYGEKANEMRLTDEIGNVPLTWSLIAVCLIVSITLLHAFCSLMPKTEN